MNNSLIKISLIAPKLKVADVRYNTEEILSLIHANEKDNAILLFPELCLTGYTAQELFLQDSLLDDVLIGLGKIRKQSEKSDALLVLGAPLRKGNRLYNCAVFMERGKILGIVPKTFIPNYGEFYEARWFASGKGIRNGFLRIGDQDIPFGTDLLFKDKNSEAVIGAEICEDLWVMDKPSTHQAMAGANILLNLSASDETIQKSAYRRNLVAVQSASTYSAYLYCSASTWESSQDLVFSGHQIIAENGSILNESIYPEDSHVLSAILDLDKITFNRIHQSTYENDGEDNYRFLSVQLPSLLKQEASLLEKADKLKQEGYSISPYPFVPQDKEERKNRCLEILRIQANGLATRVKNTGLKNLVIGISGGLDSTLALLVANEAKKIVPEIHILGITMPRTGNTSSITHKNANTLLGILCDEQREIVIDKAVSIHLKDIGHEDKYYGEGDTTYENAQARYRTYLLMDIANSVQGLVIGTGDLSELALGWCTYNGDHMSMYGVNASIPKTLVSYLVETYALYLSDATLHDTLLSILSTPISPELTPTEKGNIQQKTEDKIGKYDLNDFFLFYLLRYGFSPEKILLFAMIAFPHLTKDEIKEALIRFYKRFYSQQFKRSCLPDSVKVGSVSLSPRGDFRMASDCSVHSILERLRKL